MKPDYRGHPTVEVGKFSLLDGFEDGFPFCENKKYFILN